MTNCDSCESLTSGGEAFHQSCVYDRDSLVSCSDGETTQALFGLTAIQLSCLLFVCGWKILILASLEEAGDSAALQTQCA